MSTRHSEELLRCRLIEVALLVVGIMWLSPSVRAAEPSGRELAKNRRKK